MEKTLKQWNQKFEAGVYNSDSRKVQIEAGWYDWFCKDSSLKNKTSKIGNILKDIKSENILNNFSIWFKNNCPLADFPLYDDVRFEPLDESRRNELYFLIAIDDKRTGFKYVIYTARNNYEAEYKCKTKKELLKAIEKLGEELK